MGTRCIVKACPIQTPPWLTVIEVPHVKICKHVAPPGRHRFEAPTRKPGLNEWAIGLLRKVRRPRAATFSAAFEMAGQRGCTAITDIRASGPHAATVAVLVVAATLVAAMLVVAAIVADVIRREGIMTKTNSIAGKTLQQRTVRLLGIGFLLAAVLLPATLKDGQRTFAKRQSRRLCAEDRQRTRQAGWAVFGRCLGWAGVAGFRHGRSREFNCRGEKDGAIPRILFPAMPRR